VAHAASQLVGSKVDVEQSTKKIVVDEPQPVVDEAQPVVDEAQPVAGKLKSLVQTLPQPKGFQQQVK
jgi:hypothetical protein